MVTETHLALDAFSLQRVYQRATMKQVEMTDGTKKTIRNSNVPPGDLPALADQFHPNVRDASAHTGVDDGFVIKADA